MIPAADLILSTSMIFTRNIISRASGKDVPPASQAKMARFVVLGLTATALVLAIYAPNMLVNLLLTGYSGVTQFFPMIVLGLFWKKATKIASFCGLITGEVLVFFLILNKLDPVSIFSLHLNAGFVALIVNMAVFVTVSLLTNTEASIERKMKAITGQKETQRNTQMLA